MQHQTQHGLMEFVEFLKTQNIHGDSMKNWQRLPKMKQLPLKVLEQRCKFKY